MTILTIKANDLIFKLPYNSVTIRLARYSKIVSHPYVSQGRKDQARLFLSEIIKSPVDTYEDEVVNLSTELFYMLS